jgi:hypothetical protein
MLGGGLVARVALGSLLAVAVAGAGAGDQAPPTIAALLDRAHAAGWDTLAIGERVAAFAGALEGAPYQDRTLEGPGPEVCRVTTEGFDCVTFMEVSLDLARIARAGAADRRTPDDLRDEVTFTRYRGGRLDGYASRLHYTSEWIADNIAKGVLEDVTPSLGGVRLPLEVRFMSSHPASYPALVADPALVDSMRRIERGINAVPRTFVPRERVAAVESRLAAGDLVAIATSIPGLDYAHTGVIVRDAAGRARFMHASSAGGRVVLDSTIAGYLRRGPKGNTGITVLRPIEPR